MDQTQRVKVIFGLYCIMMKLQKQYTYILFDLDGTLTDPGVGITRSVQYALARFGIRENDLSRLYPFIGPPLKESFMRFYRFSDKEADQAVASYRERFAETGIFENEVYPEIPAVLQALVAEGKHLLVATSKPTVFADRILEHFGLKKYFEFVAGSNLDGSRVRKDEVIRYVLRCAGVSRLASAVMVGDRQYDIAGARQASIDSVGVLYGYGSREELVAAGATCLAASPGELGRLLSEKKNV